MRSGLGTSSKVGMPRLEDYWDLVPPLYVFDWLRVKDCCMVAHVAEETILRGSGLTSRHSRGDRYCHRRQRREIEEVAYSNYR